MNISNQINIWKIIKKDSTVFCPKCHMKHLKIILENYPNHLLVCGSCQSVFKIVSDNLIHVIS